MPSHPFAKQTLGILLAAGRGRRMGTLKQILPWGNEGGAGESTVVAHVFDELQPHAEAGVVVVVGNHRNEIINALGKRTFTIIQAETSAQQYESICRGLEYFVSVTEARYTLLQPADHPHIPVEVVELLFHHLAETGQDPAAIIPTCHGQGGHPALVPRSVALQIIAWKKSLAATSLPDDFQGLKTFWKQHPELIQRIETNQSAITIDLDTPDDYEQARSEDQRG